MGKSDRKEKGHDKRHKHKKDKDEKDKWMEDDTVRKKFGKEPITQATWESQYFEKHAEFKLWLVTRKKIHFDTLEKGHAKKWFVKFAKKWNAGELDPKYYAGVHSTALEGSQRSSHKWSFKMDETEKLKLEMVRDSVDTSTHRISKERALQSSGDFGPPPAAKSDVRDGDWECPSCGANCFANRTQCFKCSTPRPGQAEVDSDEWTRRRSRDKQARREDERDLVEHALGSKPTGRDALLEKRRAANEQIRGRETSPDRLAGYDEMGEDGASEFKRLLAREKARKRPRY